MIKIGDHVRIHNPNDDFGHHLAEGEIYSEPYQAFGPKVYGVRFPTEGDRTWYYTTMKIEVIEFPAF